MNLATVKNAARFGDAIKPTQHDQLVTQTQTWVSQTFFGTLLKQMRDSPFKSELFSGGSGGQAFSGLYDQHLAEHMARGAGRKLVDGIVRRIEANTAYRKQSSEKAGKSEKTDNDRPTDTRARPARKPKSNGSSTFRA